MYYRFKLYIKQTFIICIVEAKMLVNKYFWMFKLYYNKKQYINIFEL